MDLASRLLVTFCVFFIKIYQICLSPLMLSNCRFYPSCSQYAIEALRSYGFFKGTLIALKRIVRCHPFCKGGVDPVPEKTKFIIRKYK